MGTRITAGHGIYPAYLWKDHDPVLDQIDRIYELAGGPKLSMVAVKSGMSEGTLRNWRDRKTKKPQWGSVNAVVRSLGGTVTITYQGRAIAVKGLGKPRGE
jgi:hypothetical protein